MKKIQKRKGDGPLTFAALFMGLLFSLTAFIPLIGPYVAIGLGTVYIVWSMSRAMKARGSKALRRKVQTMSGYTVSIAAVIPFLAAGLVLFSAPYEVFIIMYVILCIAVFGSFIIPYGW